MTGVLVRMLERFGPLPEPERRSVEAVRLGQRVLLLSSRPGRVVAEWDVPAAARHDAPAAAALTAAITARLGQEIRRHAH